MRWTSWSLDPLVIVLAVAALAFFLHGWSRLRARRRELAPWSRVALFVAGLTIEVAAIVSPLDAIAEEYLQSAHMLQHVLLADLGIVLVVLAVRGPLTFFVLPRDLLAPLARARSVRESLSFLLRPEIAFGLWLCIVIVWHAPAAYEGALDQPLVHRLEHVSFVIVGALVWTLLIDPGKHGRLSLPQRIGFAVLLFWAGQLLSYVLLFGFEPYYGVYEEQPERLLGLSPLGDQRLAGVVMMVEQLLTLGVAIVLLLRTARRERVLSPAAREPLA